MTIDPKQNSNGFYVAKTAGTAVKNADPDTVGSGVYAIQSGAGALEKTLLIFNNVLVPMVDNAGVGAHAALKIYDFIDGSLAILGATADLALTKDATGVNATWDGDFSLGSVAADTGATLTSTEADIIPSTATPQAVAGVTTAKGRSTAVVMLDGTTTAKDMYLNLLVDDADHDVTTTPTNIIVNGQITFVHANLGDY